mmetsp:Transcript_73146/g.171519  ORF Transcript_73146/g.171519 Transcript_73146/m.171519 type:complete len:401 (+) Transcript_73146:33-1235(+)
MLPIRACIIVVIAAIAVLGRGPIEYQLHSAVLFLWTKFGTDVRLRRKYKHCFDGYGPYNYSGRTWPLIEKRDLATLTRQEFEEKFVNGRRPVILTGMGPQHQWSPEALSARCGQMPLTFARRYSAGLQAIPEWLRKLFLDPRLVEAYNRTTAQVLEAMHASRNLRDYVADLLKDEQQISTAKTQTDLYAGSIADYLFPVMVSAQEFKKTDCMALHEEGEALFKQLLSYAAGGRENAPQFRQMHPVLFVAPAGSRAIPLHQHGPFNDNLLWMLHGAKRVVVAAPSSTEWLYERPEFGGSEYADRVFSADLINPDQGKQPHVAHVQGMEGVVNGGELIYLPVNIPHAVETAADAASVMLAWQIPVPGIARMFFKKNCSFLEELPDYRPWEAKCEMLRSIMTD